MNQKLEIVKENLLTTTTVTKSSLLAGGILCLGVGIIIGIVLGMMGKGVNIKVAIGAYNGAGNHHNGCENQHNNNGNK